VHFSREQNYSSSQGSNTGFAYALIELGEVVGSKLYDMKIFCKLQLHKKKKSQ